MISTDTVFLWHGLKNQALSGLCSDWIYIERDSPNIEMNFVHTVTGWSTEESRKMRYMIFVRRDFFHTCMEELQKYARTNMHKPIL